MGTKQLCRSCVVTSDMKQKERDLMLNIGVSVMMNMEFLKQKVVTWLKSGDQNTSAFHKKVSGNRNKNIVFYIKF